MTPSSATTRRLAGGLACGTLANAAQMPFFWAAHPPVSAAFFASHLLVVLLAHLLLALLLGGWKQNRTWSAAAFALPPALALCPIAIRVAGDAGVAILFGAATWACLLWSWLPLGRGAPLVSATAGAVLGGQLVRFLAEDYRGFETEWSALARIGAVATAALGIAFGAGMLVPRVALPRLGVSLGIAAAAALAGLATGPGGLGHETSFAMPTVRGAGAAPRSPVILIVLDTVGADYLASYGSERDTMPALRRFAREKAVLVAGATSNSSWTVPTHASLFTGLYPPRHGAHFGFLGGPAPGAGAYPLIEGVPTLAELLSEAGYWTVGIAANPMALSPSYGFTRGFDVAETTPGPNARTPWRVAIQPEAPFAALEGLWPFTGGEFFAYGVGYARAASITDRALAALDAAGDLPCFLFLNYNDAHWPYRPPFPFRDRFPEPAFAWDLDALGEIVHEVNGGQRALDPTERAEIRALYEAELAYLDAELGRLLERLEEHPAWDRMLLIVTADHGEAIGEHGFMWHGVNLYGELTRVPLIIKPGSQSPGAPAPGAIWDGPMQSVDVFATILDHAGVDAPPGIDGSPWGRNRIHALSWLYVPHWFKRWSDTRFTRELRSAIRGQWKLIESTTGANELYDLASDPRESRSLAVGEGEQGEPLHSLLIGVEAARSRQDAVEDSPTAETREVLRALGYVE